MKVTRIYTGDDDRTHFQEIDVPLRDGDLGSLTDLVQTKGVIFRATLGEFEMDFHNAPQRQFVINLSGILEIETGDGTKRRLGPGEILFAEDVTGQGHISRGVGGPRQSLFILVPDGFDITRWRS